MISESLPVRDAAFDGGPLRLHGAPYESGLGVTADSEIVYALGGRYGDFSAVVGLDDGSPGDDPALRFMVFLDDILAYDSGVLRRRDMPQPFEVPAAGIQQMRLVTRGEQGHGDWADAQMRVAGPGPVPASSFLDRLLDERRRLAESRSQGRLQAQEIATQERRTLDDLFSRNTVEIASGVRFVKTPGRLTLATDALSVGVGYGGDDHGRITVLDLAGNRLLLNSVAPAVELASGERYALTDDFLPILARGYTTQLVDDPGFGPGRELRARFRSRDGHLTMWLSFRLYERHPALLYQIGIEGLPLDQPAAFLMLDPAQGGGVAAGRQPLYLTDYNRLRFGGIPDDGLLREERVGHSKPVWIWSPESNRGLLLAAIDETAASPYFTVQRAPGAANAAVAFAGGAAASIGPARVSPRLYLEATYTPHMQNAFAHFREAMAVLYPPLPFPSWVRQQWLSWYVNYFDLHESGLRKQVEQITQQFAGVGPWHLLVDAGWYVGEGRPDADWRNVDRDKFPEGLRSFVDEAHGNGVNIVLYFGTPYLNTQEAPGNWMGLTGLARLHPDWLILTGGDDMVQHYLMNYAQPELRAYVNQVMEDYYRGYGVDGMKVDGLASAEGDLPLSAAGPAWLLGERTAAQTMDIYRTTAKTARAAGGSPYIESGWSSPVFAHPYAHTFRFGDEAPAFSNPYPMGGLVEHIDYAAYQAALGQPANMGAIYGNPNVSAIPRWWLEAALAMGNQVALSFDLEALEPGPRDHLRALMAHYRPFSGETRFDGRTAPEVFATTVGPLTYVGALNRSPEPRGFT
ncbi:MAG: NPCBM/NEW2 domain-containing protein, partial [Chloroflexi bacterium]|nr:NPCBM/NEW2 domain-containing protein [Chloroflexota bacterium]